MARHTIRCAAVTGFDSCNCGIEERRKTEVQNPGLTEEDQKEIAILIASGFTSGRLDREDGRKVSWSLITDIWTD